MKKSLSLAAIAAAMLSVASCSNSAISEMKKATSGFDLTYIPVHGKTNRGLYISRYQNPDEEMIFEYSSYDIPRTFTLFHEGYACVGFEKMKAIINLEGETVVDLTDFHFEHNSGFYGCVSENRFIAQRTGAGTFVCFDMKGNEVFETEGYIRSQLRDGYALYSLSESAEKFGVINAKGEVVYEAGQDEYINITAMIMQYPESYAHPTWYPVFNDDGFAYILDVATGKHYLEDISIDYYWGDRWFGIPLVDCNDRIIVHYDRKIGLVDMEGNTIIEPQYYHLVNDGEWYSFRDEHGKFGWLDKNGEIVIDPQFEGLRGYDHAYFGTSDWAHVDYNTFINRKGEVVLETEYTIESGFIGDRCLVDVGREGYAWMDREGNLIGSPMVIYQPARDAIRHLARGMAVQY